MRGIVFFLLAVAVLVLVFTRTGFVRAHYSTPPPPAHTVPLVSTAPVVPVPVDPGTARALCADIGSFYARYPAPLVIYGVEAADGASPGQVFWAVDNYCLQYQALLYT